MPTRPPFPFATLPAPDEDHSRGEPQQTVSIVADEQYAHAISDRTGRGGHVDMDAPNRPGTIALAPMPA